MTTFSRTCNPAPTEQALACWPHRSWPRHTYRTGSLSPRGGRLPARHMPSPGSTPLSASADSLHHILSRLIGQRLGAEWSLRVCALEMESTWMKHSGSTEKARTKYVRCLQPNARGVSLFWPGIDWGLINIPCCQSKISGTPLLRSFSMVRAEEDCDYGSAWIDTSQLPIPSSRKQYSFGKRAYNNNLGSIWFGHVSGVDLFFSLSFCSRGVHFDTNTAQCWWILDLFLLSTVGYILGVLTLKKFAR